MGNRRGVREGRPEPLLLTSPAAAYQNSILWKDQESTKVQFVFNFDAWADSLIRELISMTVLNFRMKYYFTFILLELASFGDLSCHSLENIQIAKHMFHSHIDSLTIKKIICFLGCQLLAILKSSEQYPAIPILSALWCQYKPRADLMPTHPSMLEENSKADYITGFELERRLHKRTAARGLAVVVAWQQILALCVAHPRGKDASEWNISLSFIYEREPFHQTLKGKRVHCV